MKPAEVFARQRAHAPVMARTDAEARRERLRRLAETIKRRRSEAVLAVNSDLGRSEPEVELSEIHVVLAEIRHALRHLGNWMKPRRAGTVPLLAAARNRIVYVPKGVVLVLSPWNYPLALALNPVVAAVAAGNCVIVKPSEKAPECARFLESLIAEAFPPEECAVVAGDAGTARELLSLPFDHVFFTGSSVVAREVMKAAAEHLTPVTLELGGKSPAVVEADADLRLAAEYVIWGRCIGAGQSCIAPDYVLVHDQVADRFVAECRTALVRFFGPEGEARRRSPDLSRIVDDAHFDRLVTLVREAVASGATIVTGGEWETADRYFAPTVLTEVPEESAAMREEIFGPVLPVIRVRTRADAIRFVSERPHPLAIYVFTDSRAAADSWLQETKSGAVVLNGTMLHYGMPDLPFGGVGESGIGSYHGVHGFRSFSNVRSVMYHRIPWLYRLLFPPYHRRLKRLGRWVMRRFEP